jgi:pimeloyl-ACP methyl ester carboxylesterase
MEQPETRYVTVGDAQVAYQVVGDGPIDLLFHHGFCHIDLQWDVASEAGFIRRLAEFSRVILFDRRGSGASERMALGRFPTWEEWNLDVLAVLDAVGVRRCALFAEAEAGPMGLLFAAAHPERVSALILGNTAARFAAADDYPLGTTPAEVEALVGAIEPMWGTPELIEVNMPSLARNRGDIDALARLMRAAATPRVAAAQYRHILSELDARDALPFISMPTLVVTNEGSATADANALDRTQYLVDHIPGSRLVRVPGADSHLLAGARSRPPEMGFSPASTARRARLTAPLGSSGRHKVSDWRFERDCTRESASGEGTTSLALPCISRRASGGMRHPEKFWCRAPSQTWLPGPASASKIEASRCSGGSPIPGVCLQ